MQNHHHQQNVTTGPGDKRIEQVGRRISGYCGHVPTYRVLSEPTAARRPAGELDAVRADAQRRLSAAGLASGSSYAAAAAADAATSPSSSRRSASSPAPPSVPRRVSTTAIPMSSDKSHHSPHAAIKAVSGYGGHRAGIQFATGSTVNGPRKTEILSTAMHAETSAAWKQKLAGAAPIPRYPCVRGPTRTTPFGMDCFLTN